MSDELKEFLDRVHPGITTFDFEGNETPCIELEEKRYDDILSKVAGQPLSINTDLNILQDGLGNAFVDVTLTFSTGNITETFLVNAKTHLVFFQSLAKTSMLALTSPKSNFGKDKVFMIQLPRPEKAQDALEIIKNALIPKNK
ncbi:MAG: hypothetical protein ACW9W4_05855 [Candidatus Nitrosopumilus sp. bin_7KS]